MYTCVVIRPGMITKPLFNQRITDVTSSGKQPLNASSTTILCFLKYILDFLFQTTCNQAPSVHLIIHPLVWHQIINPTGSCALDIVWIYITCAGSMHCLPIPTLVTHIFSLPHAFLCHQWYNWMAHWNTLALLNEVLHFCITCKCYPGLDLTFCWSPSLMT
jgi:hypothetical protein